MSVVVANPAIVNLALLGIPKVDWSHDTVYEIVTRVHMRQIYKLTKEQRIKVIAKHT